VEIHSRSNCKGPNGKGQSSKFVEFTEFMEFIEFVAFVEFMEFGGGRLETP
jgi:hypothetical protein